jgi:hypothetical protein
MSSRSSGNSDKRIFFHSRIDRDLAQMLLFDDFGLPPNIPRSMTGNYAVACSSAFSATKHRCSAASRTPIAEWWYIHFRLSRHAVHGIVMDKWHSVSSAPLSSGLFFWPGAAPRRTSWVRTNAACSDKMGPLGICASDLRRGGSATLQVPGQTGHEAYSPDAARWSKAHPSVAIVCAWTSTASCIS